MRQKKYERRKHSSKKCYERILENKQLERIGNKNIEKSHQHSVKLFPAERLAVNYRRDYSMYHEPERQNISRKYEQLALVVFSGAVISKNIPCQEVLKIQQHNEHKNNLVNDGADPPELCTFLNIFINISNKGKGGTGTADMVESVQYNDRPVHSGVSMLYKRYSHVQSVRQRHENNKAYEHSVLRFTVAVTYHKISKQSYKYRQRRYLKQSVVLHLSFSLPSLTDSLRGKPRNTAIFYAVSRASSLPVRYFLVCIINC